MTMTKEKIRRALEKYDMYLDYEGSIQDDIEVTADEFLQNKFTTDLKYFIQETTFCKYADPMDLRTRLPLDDNAKEVLDWYVKEVKKQLEKEIIDNVQEDVRLEIERQLLTPPSNGHHDINKIKYNVSDSEIVVTPNSLVRWLQGRVFKNYSANMPAFTHEEKLDINRRRALKCTEYIALNLKDSILPNFESVEVDDYDITIKF